MIVLRGAEAAGQWMAPDSSGPPESSYFLPAAFRRADSDNRYRRARSWAYLHRNRAPAIIFKHGISPRPSCISINGAGVVTRGPRPGGRRSGNGPARRVGRPSACF